MHKITVNTQPNYSIYINDGLLNSELLLEHCQKTGNRIIVISDSNVAPLYGQTLISLLQKNKIANDLLIISAGEQSKTRKNKRILEDRMLELGCGRDTTVIGLGGGVVTDLAGFVSATYCRGIKFIFIPTTLLAMVDASIGGKNGVNTSFGKNLIGTIKQPNAIFIDPLLLKTLPQKEILNGIVEMIKHSLIADADHFQELYNSAPQLLNLDSNYMSTLIANNCQIKCRIIEQDSHETELRKILNFGHTIGHAIEHLSNYELHHGQAVAMGIRLANVISNHLGLLSNEQLKLIENIFKRYKISQHYLHSNFTVENIQHIICRDKKAIKQQAHFVLLDAIGKVHKWQNGLTTAVDPEILSSILFNCLNSYSVRMN